MGKAVGQVKYVQPSETVKILESIFNRIRTAQDDADWMLKNGDSFYFEGFRSRLGFNLRRRDALTKKKRHMKTTIKFGMALLATGAFFGITLPSKAETPDMFTKHGLATPGVYFAQKESPNSATVAVSKSGQGIGEQKQTVTKVGKKHQSHVRSTKKAS